MNKSPDAIVVGLGVMGAAVACELARRGAIVLGLDGRAPPHDQGSSHGRSRIIREAYYEHPLYVPFVQRAYELWQELEELTGAALYRRTGGLMVGPEQGALVSGTLASVRAHQLEHEVLDADAIRRRFPGLLPEPDHVGVLEPRAGALHAEGCVRTLLDLARGYGAALRTNAPVTSWSAGPSGDVTVEADGLGRVTAPLMVLAAGAWLNPLLAAETTAPSRTVRPLQLPLIVERQVSHWFMPAPGAHAFRPDVCPIALWEYAPGRILYTFPDTGRGVKAGIHQDGAAVDPDDVERTVSAHDDERARQLLEWCMPGAAYRATEAAVCLYTNTPDRHFLIDRHPAHEQVLLVSPCSGHGFKFATAVGEAVAELLLDGGSRFDLSPFAVGRLL